MPWKGSSRLAPWPPNVSEASASQSTHTRRWPASTAYLRTALRDPRQARPGRIVAALLPEGDTGNEPLGHGISQLHPQGWPVLPLWIPAVHLDTGARVVFGREGAPTVDGCT